MENKIKKKMYKTGKRWVIASIVLGTMYSGGLLGQLDVSADTVNPNVTATNGNVTQYNVTNDKDDGKTASQAVPSTTSDALKHAQDVFNKNNQTVPADKMEPVITLSDDNGVTQLPNVIESNKYPAILVNGVNVPTTGIIPNHGYTYKAYIELPKIGPVTAEGVDFKYEDQITFSYDPEYLKPLGENDVTISTLDGHVLTPDEYTISRINYNEFLQSSEGINARENKYVIKFSSDNGTFNYHGQKIILSIKMVAGDGKPVSQIGYNGLNAIKADYSVTATYSDNGTRKNSEIYNVYNSQDYIPLKFVSDNQGHALTASDKNPNDLGNYSEFLKNYSIKGFNYVVQAGETVASLANDTGYNMDYILKLNHLPSNANLRAGQILLFGHIYDKEVIPTVNNDSNKVTTKPNSSVTDKNVNVANETASVSTNQATQTKVSHSNKVITKPNSSVTDKNENFDNKSLEIRVNQVQINSKNVTLPQTGTDNKLSSMLGFSLMAFLVTFALAGVKRSKVEK